VIQIHVPGQPQGKGRARAYKIKRGRRAGKIGHFTPEKTRTYESIIRSYAMVEMAGKKRFECPVAIDLQLYYEIPESWPAWKREMALNGKIAPTVKPDCDNVEKAIKDALNGVVWVDDVQVVMGVKMKTYAEVGSVSVKVRPTGQLPANIKHKPIEPPPYRRETNEN